MTHNQGSITGFLLLISSTFIIVMYALVFMLSNQFDTSQRQTASDQALFIAEAGIEYYRWHLAHAPDDYQDGTCAPGNPCENDPGPYGPFEHSYADPQGKEIGSYSLTIEPPLYGSTIVTIESTGWLNQFPEAKRVVRVQYGVPSLTRFSFLSNSFTHYGAGITVNGEVHSNSGIQMDGINTSIVSSALTDYEGHDPIWGSGPNWALWEFGVDNIDFDSVSADFGNIWDATVVQGIGLHLGPSGGAGYRIVFVNNGTFNLYRVNSTSGYRYRSGFFCVYDSFQPRITSQSFLATYSVADTPVVLSEDHTWVEGTLDGQITVAAVRFPIGSHSTNAWINNNLMYKDLDNSDVLGLIAYNDIAFVRDVPQNFSINGVLLANQGKVHRHYYRTGCDNNYADRVKTSLNITGSILSRQRGGWNYGGEPPVSGFITRTTTYDANLLYSPPPYFPTEGEYEFISWEEQ